MSAHVEQQWLEACRNEDTQTIWHTHVWQLLARMAQVLTVVAGALLGADQHTSPDICVSAATRMKSAAQASHSQSLNQFLGIYG